MAMNYVGSISILDRGDAPAQAVIDRNARSLAQRIADETKDELEKVMTRVETVSEGAVSVGGNRPLFALFWIFFDEEFHFAASMKLLRWCVWSQTDLIEGHESLQVQINAVILLCCCYQCSDIFGEQELGMRVEFVNFALFQLLRSNTYLICDH